MSGTEEGGYDQVAVTDGDRKKHYTRSEFEALPLADRVRYLMSPKTQFFRNGVLISARDALHER